MEHTFKQTPQFNSPEEELNFLRAAVRDQQEKLQQLGIETNEEKLIRQNLSEYKSILPSEALAQGHRMENTEVEAIVLDLAPEAHDSQMEELLGILQERGIMNALSVVSALHNPHIEDDFHRVLIQYIKVVEDESMKKNVAEKIFEELMMTLYEVSLPVPEKEDKNKALKELISGMEQFYSGMISVDLEKNKQSNRNYYSLEIALPHDSNEVSFFMAVPDGKKDLFEKQILATFPDAHISESKNDYNIFNNDGISVAAYASPSGNVVFPIKTYEEFDHDPLNVILNVFSKLERIGEGAAIQLLISPVGDFYQKQYKSALKKIKDGVSVKDATDFPKNIFGDIWKTGKDFWDLQGGEEAKRKKEKAREHVDESVVKMMEEKMVQ